MSRASKRANRAAEDVAVFCRQVRERSEEHRRSTSTLRGHGVPGQLISILRQELDSMVRVIFLLAQQDRSYRRQLVAASVHGKRWRRRNKKAYVTDREMIDLAQRLHGWTASVYKFGCSFVHLPKFHDYRSRDPFLSLPNGEREDIVSHLRYYHVGPAADEPTFNDIIPLLPAVFDKVAGNLECYLKDLEADGDIEAESE